MKYLAHDLGCARKNSGPLMAGGRRPSLQLRVPPGGAIYARTGAVRNVMRTPKVTRVDARKAACRIPLTIMLDPDHHAFIESCVSLKEFDSVDKLFDAALGFYRRHLHALMAYAEDQSHKGYSRAEILQFIECETVVTKAVGARPLRRR
jgi:hypothetical protein